MRGIYVLKDQKLQRFGRASNMVWLHFGKTYETTNKLNMKVQKSEYALHVQCPWRIINNNSGEIFVGSNDIYEQSGIANKNKNADWETQGNSLFDEKVSELCVTESDFRVSKVRISRTRDLTITFSNNYQFQCFANSSSDVEYWRFISRNQSRNFVAYESGFKME